MGRHSKPDSDDSFPDEEPEGDGGFEPEESSYSAFAEETRQPDESYDYPAPGADDYPDFGVRPSDPEPPDDAGPG